MSLEEGAINYTDLSPNANIQGTQIADKTLRLRNLSDDTFGVVKSGTATLNANATAGTPITTTVAHNLGYTPAFLVYFNFNASTFSQLPNSTGFNVSGVNVAFNNWAWATADNTNLYITFISGTTTNWGTFNYKYYLLQESATA